LDYFTALCILVAEGFKVPDLGTKVLPQSAIKEIIRSLFDDPLGTTETLEDRVDSLGLWRCDSPSKTWGGGKEPLRSSRS
jgi:hypothetical protein